jgi:hypothetical protein
MEFSGSYTPKRRHAVTDAVCVNTAFAKQLDQNLIQSTIVINDENTMARFLRNRHDVKKSW